MIRTARLCAAAAIAVLAGVLHAVADGTPPSRAPSAKAEDMPAVLGDLAQYFVPVPAYRESAGTDRLAIALGIIPPLQIGSPDTDVSALRLALVSCHHNVSVADVSLLFGRTRGAARGVQFSVANVVEGPARGVQLGVAANVAGTAPESDSAGIQAAFGVNWADTFSGVQLSALFNRSSKGGFAQVAAVCNSSDDFSGVQFAAVNLRGNAFSGTQIGVLNGGAESFSGLQFGFFANSAVPLGSAKYHATLDGWQIALLANAADELDGGQVSLVNLAGDVRGVQVGLYNSARRLHGVQIGLVNRCADSSTPFLPFFRAAF